MDGELMKALEARAILGKFVPGEKMDQLYKLDAILEAMKSLDKQIPQKPELEDRYGRKLCPMCGSFVKNAKITMRFCSNCGQMLDWNEK